jgi:hypothetical protein
VESLRRNAVRRIREEEMTVVGCIVVVGNIVVDIGLLGDQKIAVGKLPRAVHTVLVKVIHNPHLVNRYMGLGEERKEIHSERSNALVGG